MFEIGDLVKMKQVDIYLLVTPKTSKYSFDFSGIVLYSEFGKIKVFEYSKYWKIDQVEKVNEKITFDFQNDQNLSINVGDFVTYKNSLIAVVRIERRSTFNGIILAHEDKNKVGQWANGLILSQASKVESAMITL